MSQIEFGRLEDLPLREAWRHEAHQFTPWLAENINHLAEAIGIPLELTGTEVSVENFSADILARNPMDESVVLIENQLETTDHTHLGQIMTYLAGLEAHTVVWIAPGFREPHLSAIRWLNEHTADGFSFFAVKARVVRIGDSPLAPIFEVVEKPNDWERRLSGQRATAAKGTSDLGDLREAYWNAYVERHPETRVRPSRSGYFAVQAGAIPDLRVVLYIGQKDCGIFIRGARGMDASEFNRIVEPRHDALRRLVGLPEGGGTNQYLSQSIPESLADREAWPRIQDWHEEQLETYLGAIESAIAGTEE
jgi:hypothetical protein